MVRYLLTNLERAILATYIKGEKIENQTYLDVIMHRLRKLDLDVIRSDLKLIENAKS